MNNNKGMTLIEVVIALFLLGLITIVFLPSIWSSYKMMKKAKNITVDIFATQQNVEQKLEECRDKINEYNKDTTNPNPMNKYIKVFGKKINGISIEEPIICKEYTTNNRGYIYAFVAEKPIIDEKLPEVEWVNLNIESPIYWKNNSLIGSYKTKNNSNYFMSLKRWYISKPWFDGNIPADKIDNESDLGTRYPSWPNDYELINNNNTDKLSDLNKYVGRYIVYSIIPVAKNGKYGYETKSKEVYIMGPPKLDNLKFHLDPYTLRDKEGNFIEDGDVEKWKEFLPFINKEFEPNYTNTSKMVLSYIKNDGKALLFNNTEAKIDYSPTNNNQFTIFLVYRNTSPDYFKTQNILKVVRNNQNGWELKLNNGRVEFKLIHDNESKSLVQSSTTENDKYIITGTVSNSNFKMILDKEQNKEELNDLFSYAANSNDITMILGDTLSEENIYEVIIYNSVLSDEEVNAIRVYLSEKHKIQLIY